eukprot:COSAG01_NODE_15938_length_1284_cov_58.007595_2_plen_83_part_00
MTKQSVERSAEVDEVAALEDKPVAYSLKTLGNGQEIWVPLGAGACAAAAIAVTSADELRAHSCGRVDLVTWLVIVCERHLDP